MNKYQGKCWLILYCVAFNNKLNTSVFNWIQKQKIYLRLFEYTLRLVWNTGYSKSDFNIRDNKVFQKKA